MLGSCRIASASSGTSVATEPEPRKPGMDGRMSTRSVPIALIRSRIEFCAPVPMASMVTTELTPMTMPSKVRIVRKILARSARIAIFTASEISAICAAPLAVICCKVCGASLIGISRLVVSDRICPSRISISRSARSATSRAWVITIIV